MAMIQPDDRVYTEGEGKIDPVSGWAKFYNTEYQAEYYYNFR